jgi:hypothetical protein
MIGGWSAKGNKQDVEKLALPVKPQPVLVKCVNVYSKVLLLYNRSIPKETSNKAQMLDLGIDGPNMAKDHDIIL